MFWFKFKHINEQETRGSRSSRETWQYNTAEAHTQTHLLHTPNSHTQTRTTASCFVAFRIKLPTFFVVCRFSFIFSCASFPLLSSIPLLALLLPLNVVCISVYVCVKFFYNKSFLLFVSLSLSFARCCCMFHFETRFHFKLRELSTSLWSLLDFNLISHTRTHTYVSHIYMYTIYVCWLSAACQSNNNQFLELTNSPSRKGGRLRQDLLGSLERWRTTWDETTRSTSWFLWPTKRHNRNSIGGSHMRLLS